VALYRSKNCSPQQLNLPYSGLNAYTSLADRSAGDSLVLLVLRLSLVIIGLIEELNLGHRDWGGACTAANILLLFVADETSAILCFIWNCSSSSSSLLLSSSRSFATSSPLQMLVCKAACYMIDLSIYQRGNEMICM